MTKIPILSVKPLKQSKPAFCGPAALRILVDYLGIKKTESALARICKTSYKLGTHPWDLINAIEKLGLGSESGEEGGWGLLNEYVNKKKLPVLVDWFKVDDGHYSVVCGLSKRFIWIADPAEAKIIRMPWRTFRRIWFDFEGDVLKKKKNLYLRWWLVAHK